MSIEIPQDNQNLMSLQGFFYQTSNFSSKIGTIKDEAQNLLASGMQRMDQEILNAQANEEKILKLLGYDNIDDLNEAIKRYEGAKFPLSGSALKRAFTNGLQSVTGYNIEDIIPMLEQATNQSLEKNIDFNSLLTKALNTIHKQLGGKKNLRYSQGYASSKEGDNFFKASNLSKDQKKAFEALLTQYNKNHPKNKINKKVFTIETEVKSDKVTTSLTGNWDWQTETKFLTPSKAEEELSNKEVGKINRQIYTHILASCNNDIYIAKILGHILRQNKYVFFVGANTKDITGLLGEIKGMYYLAQLLGIDKIGTDIVWRGGTYTGEENRKPHQDILLKEKFGIQVKNTTIDITSNFSSYFANASLDTVFADIDSEFKDIMLRYYGTLSFNVPYRISKKGAAIKGINKKHPKANSYLSRRAHIEELNILMQKALSVYASSLMYMGVDKIKEKSQIEDTNSLYFIAGKSFILVSDILKDIKAWIQDQSSSKPINIKTTAKYSIVDAYNEGNLIMKLSDITPKVHLTSSYNFKVVK